MCKDSCYTEVLQLFSLKTSEGLYFFNVLGFNRLEELNLINTVLMASVLGYCEFDGGVVLLKIVLHRPVNEQNG